MNDPFAALGVPPTMDLDEDELERRYLELSRTSHPDHSSGSGDRQGDLRGDLAAQTAVLERAAQVNDAFRLLRDRWSRARALIERADPHALEASKKLCPIFLMDALEQAEEVAHAAPPARAELRARIDASIRATYDELCRHVAAGDWKEAATALHKAGYHRKALTDLDDRDE